jgi:hypothetical protein
MVTLVKSWYQPYGAIQNEGLILIITVAEMGVVHEPEDCDNPRPPGGHIRMLTEFDRKLRGFGLRNSLLFTRCRAGTAPRSSARLSDGRAARRIDTLTEARAGSAA